MSNNTFSIWGFSLFDISNKKFVEEIDKNILRRVSFSTKTILPKDSPIKLDSKMYEIESELINLHNQGINGEGINVAIIDFGFKFPHNEIENAELIKELEQLFFEKMNWN